MYRAFLTGGYLNPGERHSSDTRDDGTVTLCTLRAATVLSRNCCADFGRPLAKKVMSHLRDGPGVTAPLRTNIVPLTRVWSSPLPFRYPPLKGPRMYVRQPILGSPVWTSFSAINSSNKRPFLGKDVRSTDNLQIIGNGRPIFIQCGCWGELCSPCEVARPQPSTG